MLHKADEHRATSRRLVLAHIWGFGDANCCAKKIGNVCVSGWL